MGERLQLNFQFLFLFVALLLTADVQGANSGANVKLPDVVPPLVAALDSNDPDLIVDVISVFMRRGSKEVVPHLWFDEYQPTDGGRLLCRLTVDGITRHDPGGLILFSRSGTSTKNTR